MNISIYDRRWCAVQVRPRQELLVSAILRNKGYEEYLPTYNIKRQWVGRGKEVAAPLFPGYVFCRLNCEIRAAIVTTPGVVRIVGTRKEIAVIDDQEIEAIQRIVKSGLKVEPCAYTIGDRVRFISGPFEGVEGIVTHYKNQRRLVLSIDLIQSSMSVEVDTSDLILLTKAAKPFSCDRSPIALHEGVSRLRA